MKFSGNDDSGPRKSSLNLSDVPNLTFGLQKIEGKDQGLARGIEYTVKRTALVCDLALLLPIYT